MVMTTILVLVLLASLLPVFGIGADTRDPAYSAGRLLRRSDR